MEDSSEEMRQSNQQFYNQQFEKIRFSKQPLCPLHEDEFANIVCVDPTCNLKKKEFKIMCPECEHTDDIHQMKGKPHVIKSFKNVLNHIVDKCNEVGDNQYTHAAITDLMDKNIEEIEKIIEKLKTFIQQIYDQKEEINEVFSRKDDAKKNIGQYLDTIRDGETDDYNLMQSTLTKIAQVMRYESPKKQWVVDVVTFKKEWDVLDAKVNAKYKQYQTLTHDINTDIAKFLNQKPPAKPKPDPPVMNANGGGINHSSQDEGIVADYKSFRQTASNPKSNNLHLTDIPIDTKKKFVINNNTGFIGLGIATQNAVTCLENGLDPTKDLKDQDGIYLAGSNEKTFGKFKEFDMEGLKLEKDWCVEVYVRNHKLTIKTAKNPKLGDYAKGSKAKNCQITMNKSDNIEDYRIVACITGKDDSIEEI